MTKIWANAFWGPAQTETPSPLSRRRRTLMIGSTTGLVALSLAIATAAGPLYELSERAGAKAPRRVWRRARSLPAPGLGVDGPAEPPQRPFPVDLGLGGRCGHPAGAVAEIADVGGHGRFGQGPECEGQRLKAVGQLGHLSGGCAVR